MISEHFNIIGAHTMENKFVDLGIGSLIIHNGVDPVTKTICVGIRLPIAFQNVIAFTTFKVIIQMRTINDIILTRTLIGDVILS